MDESADLAYAFVWLNEALSHTPLLSEGHISATMDGAPSADAHGQLHQLQICKLLHHKDMVVCLEGLNGRLEALHFTFQELPLWDAAAPSKPIHKPQLIEVDLSSMQPESMTTAIPVPTTTLVLPPSLANTIEPHSDIAVAINLQLQGHWNGCSGLPPIASAPTSQYSMPRREPPLAALEALPSTRETEDPLRPEGMDSAIPALMATLMQMSLWVAPPALLTLLTHCSSQLCRRHQRWWACGHPPRVIPVGLLDKLLVLQEKMNMALEWLLTNRATGDLCCKELDLNMELAAHLNEAQATEAIKQAEVCHTTTACALQWAHRESVLVLEHQTKVEERWDCQVFVEAFRVAIWACPTETYGTLLYPIQLLTGDVPLATLLRMLATAQLWAVVDRWPAPAAPIPSVLEVPVPQVGAKCLHHSSDQGVPIPRQEEEEMAEIDDTSKEHPCCKQKEGRLAVNALKELCWEAFSKELEVVKVTRQAYYKAH